MDAQTVKAIDLLYDAANEVVKQAQHQLDLADRLFQVVSALHDFSRDEAAVLRFPGGRAS